MIYDMCVANALPHWTQNMRCAHAFKAFKAFAHHADPRTRNDRGKRIANRPNNTYHWVISEGMRIIVNDSVNSCKMFLGQIQI